MLPSLLTRARLSQAEAPAEEYARSFASLAVPMAGSLLQTFGMVWWVCTTPSRGSLGALAWLRTATVFLMVAGVAHAFAVWLNRWIFRGQVDAPAGLLIAAIWPSVVWVPLLILLMREQSVWSMVVPGVIAVSAVSALRRWTDRSGEAAEGPTVSTLVEWGKPAPFLRTMAPAFGCSAALHAAVAEMLRGEPQGAGWMLALGVGLGCWRYPLRFGEPGSPIAGTAKWRVSVSRTLLVWVLLLVALLPYVGSKRLALAFGGALGANRPLTAAVKRKGTADERSPKSYSGVILLFSAKPHHVVMLPPRPEPPHAGFRERRPVVIPFDGAYWYFKLPDGRPRADAPVVRGDPRLKQIRSTDFQPLMMEAHQRLDSPIRMDCCRAIRVTVQSGDPGRGTISLEVRLERRGLKDAAAVSLGSQIVPSSTETAAVGTEGADEVLTFAFPPMSGHAQRGTFDEITVAIRSTRDRARTGVHLAIQTFELTPR